MLRSAQIHLHRLRLPYDRASTGRLLDLPGSLGVATDQTYSAMTAKLAGVSDRMLGTNGSPPLDQDTRLNYALPLYKVESAFEPLLQRLCSYR